MAHKVTRIKESIVVIEPKHTPNWDDAAKERWLKGWAEEVVSTLRDSRQMDDNDIQAEHVYEDVCSECDRELEIEVYDGYGEDKLPHCSWCGAVIESEAATKAS